MFLHKGAVTLELHAAHAWSPRVSVPSHWPAPYRVMADELRFPILDVHEA